MLTTHLVSGVVMIPIPWYIILSQVRSSFFGVVVIKGHQAMHVLAYISAAVTLGLVELVAGVSWEKSATNLHHTLPPFDERSGATPPIFNKRSETIHPLPCKFF